MLLVVLDQQEEKGTLPYLRTRDQVLGSIPDRFVQLLRIAGRETCGFGSLLIHDPIKRYKSVRQDVLLAERPLLCSLTRRERTGTLDESRLHSVQSAAHGELHG